MINIDINELLNANKIAIYAELDIKEKSYIIYKNNSVELSSYNLFTQIIIHSEFEDICSFVKNKELLPAIWEQGDTKCCMFPVKSGNIICLFFESKMNPADEYMLCKKYMGDFSFG